MTSTKKFKRNSITARLYRWFYNIEDMPGFICPYFWKLVIMWVFLVPFAVITFPNRIHKLTSNKAPGNEKIASGILSYVIVFFAFCMIFLPISYIFYGLFPMKNGYSVFQQVGFISWGGSMIIAIVISFLYLREKYKERKELEGKRFIYNELYERIENPDFVESRPNVIVEFFKSVYNKYCAKIDWE